jgi:hypothetical protein
MESMGTNFALGYSISSVPGLQKTSGIEKALSRNL